VAVSSPTPSPAPAGGRAAAPRDSSVGDAEPAERTLELLSRHGWNATAAQTLGEGYAYFFHRDGYVAYADTGFAWVAAGGPICADEALADTVQAFVQRARERGRRACFFGTEARLIAATESQTKSVLLGEQPVWNPTEWPATLKANSGLREQLRRARAKGVVVEQLAEEQLASPEVHHAFAGIVERWLATRAMPPMGFLVRLPSRPQKPTARCFVARHQGRLVVFALVIPVPGRDGWFVEHLLRDPRAPNGSVESVIDAVMRWAAAAGSRWLTLGLAPLAGEVAQPLRLARRYGGWLYDFEGLRRFKAKLRPGDWMPIYLTLPAEESVSLAVVASLAAFAPGGLVRFGLRTIARGPRLVLAALVVLLVPWIALIAVAPADPWFHGHAGIKWAWVVFDLLMLAGFVRLARHPSVAFAGALATATAADALLTTIEALAWSFPTVRSLPEALLILAACLAPALATVVLLGARGRLLQRTRGAPDSPARQTPS
jgi:phosphatidylglycerol lysyltransferase